MSVYAVLPRWQANRVYGATTPALLEAEVGFLLGGEIRSEPAEIGGVRYLLLHCDEPLDNRRRRLLSNVSLLHALFEVGEGARGELATLRPVAVERRAVVDDDVVTIQRYTGKTNEQFTHLLVNLALAAAGDAFDRVLDGKRVCLLDPVCGRGTTLNHAVLYGMDALGVESDRRDVEAYEHFILTWLKDKRMKHSAQRSKIRKGPAAGSQTLAIAYRATKGGPERRIEVVRDDTINTAVHFPKRSVDVLVADLPYGVQHQGHADEVLAGALPAWTQVLKRGGAMSMAWNLKTTPRARVTDLLRANGLTPIGADDDDAFVHRVDRTITRDAIAAVLS